MLIFEIMFLEVLFFIFFFFGFKIFLLFIFISIFCFCFCVFSMFKDVFVVGIGFGCFLVGFLDRKCFE